MWEGEWSVEATWNLKFNDSKQIWLEEGALGLDASGLYARGELLGPRRDGWHFFTPGSRKRAIWSLDEAVSREAWTSTQQQCPTWLARCTLPPEGRHQEATW